jgi:deoxyadenosine kinase
VVLGGVIKKLLLRASPAPTITMIALLSPAIVALSFAAPRAPLVAHRAAISPCMNVQKHRAAISPCMNVEQKLDIDVSAAATAAHKILKQEKVFISIAGLIGAGKSTLAKALGEAVGLPVYYEPIATDETMSYLDDFYSDMKKWSFPLQIHLLNKRFRQQQEIVWSDAGAIQDRSIYEDAVFARVLADDGLMDPRDYQTYVELFKSMSRFMQRPDVMVYLDVSPEESFRRIKLRQRECESGMTLDYLIKLHAAYEAFIADISKSMHVIRIDYSEFRSASEMASEIARQRNEFPVSPDVAVESVAWAKRERA